MERAASSSLLLVKSISFLHASASSSLLLGYGVPASPPAHLLLLPVSARASANPLSRCFSPLQRTFQTVLPSLPLFRSPPPVNVGTTLAITAAVLVVALIKVLTKSKERAGGSVAELVRRGQLRSDRRSDSRPLKYEDPFNNPMMKVGERNSVKMYGKMFRLQPVTLTEEKMLSHQSRRVQAYQWKRPTVFLIEGEPIPDGIDPDTVRWIPSNHPFATAKHDIDEAAAEKNIYQTRGVPSRVRAEHEALRKRMMEAAERETAVIYPGVSGQGNGTERFPSFPEQPGSEDLFDKPGGDSTNKLEHPANFQSPIADSGQPFSEGHVG